MSRLFKQSVIADLPAPEPQSNTTIHQAPSWAGLVFAGVLAVIVIVPLFAIGTWKSAAYVVEQAGFKDGESTLASAIILSMVGLMALGVISYLFRSVFDKWTDYRLELVDREIERLRVMHQLQNSVVADSRELDPQTKRRNALIVALATDALQGRENLSYRKAGDYVLSGETEALGKDSTVVRAALTWLREHGAVAKNKWTDRYTSIGQIQRELHNPIVKNS